MNRDDLVKRERLPWSSTPKAHDLDVWDQYEVPLTGTFRVDGATTILFTAITAPMDRLSVWGYLSLGPEEAEQYAAAEFESLDELRSFVTKIFQGRDAIMALADDCVIKRWSPVHIDEDEDLVHGATQFLTDVLDALNPSPRTQLQAKLAAVDVSADDLVDA